MVVGRKVNFGVTLPLACYMTLGKFPNLSNGEFPHLQNSDNKSPYLLWLLGKYIWANLCNVLAYSSMKILVLIIIVDFYYYFHLELK